MDYSPWRHKQLDLTECLSMHAAYNIEPYQEGVCEILRMNETTWRDDREARKRPDT